MSMVLFVFFNDTATTEIYTLSLHDALPISNIAHVPLALTAVMRENGARPDFAPEGSLALKPWFGSSAGLTLPPDRKSTRLNSSHANISYAVFCLKKKKNS